MSKTTQKQISYAGTFERSMDAKNRVTIPAGWLNGGPDESEDDQSFGLLLGGGLAFPFAERWRAGFDLRAVAGTDLEYGGVETNADYGQFSAFIGVAW